MAKVNLTFEKKGNNLFVATFTANADFNLHVDAKEQGHTLPWSFFGVYRKNPEAARYSMVEGFRGDVLDADFSALVYPVDIKVESNYDATGFYTEA